MSKLELWQCDGCGYVNTVNRNQHNGWLESECPEGHIFHLCQRCRPMHELKIEKDPVYCCPICGGGIL